MRKKSSSTFSSKKRAKKHFYFFALFYLLYFVSLGVFLVSPQSFYWRSWEYFTEIGFKIPDHQRWEGTELGEFARNYLYSFQQTWDTEASCDELGFRTTPYRVEKYPVFFSGDSNTWGAILSDRETIPWIVSEKLKVPILNGGRGSEFLGKLLNFHKTKDAKIIVELVSEHRLNDSENLSLNFVQEKFVPRASNQSYWNFFDIHPKRFFLPLKPLRFLNAEWILNELERSKFDDYHILYKDDRPYQIRDFQVKKFVEVIEQKACELGEKGYTYVFAILPNRMLMLGNSSKQERLERAESLKVIFKAKNIHYIDLFQSFYQQEDIRKCYFQNDSHFSAEGAKIIADAVATYLSTNFDETLQPFVQETANSQSSIDPEYTQF